MKNVYVLNSQRSTYFPSTGLKSDTKIKEKGLPPITKLCFSGTLIVSHVATLEKETWTGPELYK